MRITVASMCRVLTISCLFVFSTTSEAASGSTTRQIGVARVDITPDFPVRLNGYLGRNAEVTNAAQHLFAKALVIGSDREGPAVIVTIDNCILPHAFRAAVLSRIGGNAHVTPQRLAICVSHTHSAPCLSGAAPNLFGMDIPSADQEHIDRYTRELVDKVEEVVMAALKDRKPATLSWGQDHAEFAANRRTAGGPVDHDLPFMTVTDPNGHLRAIFANYACHCTTVTGGFTQFCGDWAGYAQEYLQADHPGVIALTAVGCGADSNPNPRGTLELAQKHGREFADAVNRALGFTLKPLNGKLECRTKTIELAFDTLPTRTEWEALGKQDNPTGYHARKNLARLDHGEKLETSIPYMAQTWNFGNDLAMVFLNGEVVVDYSLRLKKEYDASRLWMNGYANEVQGYIPSERILKEGGYEGGGAMIYYDHPTRFATGIEDAIIGAVHDLLPKEFLADGRKAEFPPPKSPGEALASIRTRAGFKVELVASEPLIVDPVAIDFGADGKLWVVEMRDYPSGMDGNWKPGGRIKFLEDTNGDGNYDKATVFMDNLPFPTGVMPWRNGALVCSAPNIWFGEDTNHDGFADGIKDVLTGFFTDNYQARVNGLSYGLDNWVYGANGLLGGVIHGMAGGQEVDIRGRDFRMHPDTGVFEPVSGLTQQGRARDDWGNWFGCDNSDPLWNYPLPDHYIRRNPFVVSPSPRVNAAVGPNPTLLHPTSRLLERFNNPNSANHVTSGCGLGIYRDTLLGPEYYGNEFTCEPVHNLVHRLLLKESEDGALVSGVRPPGEEDAEFFSSSDNWSRPVQAKTGPDGALYIVDMYRFVIEHPRWISKERLAELDVRAGDDKGRIFRVYPEGAKLRKMPNLRKMPVGKLASMLDTPNGTLRDLIQEELVLRADKSAAPLLRKLAARSASPAVRLQAYCALDGLGALTPGLLLAALADSDTHVRRQAIRLSEPELSRNPSVAGAVLNLAGDASVRFQLALSLGEWNDPRAGKVLGQIALAGLDNSWVRAAVLSSSTHQPAEILRAVLAAPANAPGRENMTDQLMATACGLSDPATLNSVLSIVAPAEAGNIEAWRYAAMKSLLDALARKQMSLAAIAAKADASTRDTLARLSEIFVAARKLAIDEGVKPNLRGQAILILGRGSDGQSEDLELLRRLVKPENPTAVQKAALENLKLGGGRDVPEVILADWQRQSPSSRAEILDVLFSREEYIRQLLAAVHAGTIQPNEISPVSRQRLLKHSDEAIRTEAAALLSSSGSSNRSEIIAKYHDATTLSGNTARGAAQFAKNCSTCHQLRGQGFAVGPNLMPLAGKPAADWLLNILDPNAVVEPRYVSYNIEMRDGRSLSGIVNAETATTLALVQPGGTSESILRQDISSIKATGLSLMPEGFEQALSPQDMADLISFLNSNSAPVAANAKR